MKAFLVLSFALLGATATASRGWPAFTVNQQGTIFAIDFESVSHEARISSYLPNGTPNVSFANGGQLALPALDVGHYIDISVAANGSLYVLSYQWAGNELSVHLTHVVDGRLNPQFGPQGTRLIYYPLAGEVPHALGVDSQGRVVIAYQGFNGRPLESRALLIRLLPSGVRDESFGRDRGTVWIPRFANSHHTISSITFDRDDNLMLAVELPSTRTSRGLRVLRTAHFGAQLSSDGRSFRRLNTGPIWTQVPSTSSASTASFISRDGRTILIARSTRPGGLSIERYFLATGDRDASFDSFHARTYLGTQIHQGAETIRRMPDGRIVFFSMPRDSASGVLVTTILRNGTDSHSFFVHNALGAPCEDLLR